MNSFFAGFEKRATGMAMPDPYQPPQQQQAQPEQPSAWKRWALPAAATAAAGLGTYAFLRRGGAKGPLTRVISHKGETAPTGIRKFIDKVTHGTDEIHYQPEGYTTYHKKPKKVKGTVVIEDPSEAKSIIGDRTVGLAKDKVHQRRLDNDKLYEARFINRYSPEHGIKTTQMGKYHGTMKGLRELHEGTKGDYFIKARSSYGTGVGGAGHISGGDIQAYLKGSRLPKEKIEMIEHFRKNPQQYIHQPDIGIKDGLISGQPRELRVHAVGGKVVSGATSPRTGNWEDVMSTRKAEKFFQAFLDKLPKHVKDRNMFYAPDIAITPEGMKIIELNAGSMASGLLDPNLLAREGVMPALTATRGNWALYRNLMGRSHWAPAAMKATGAAGVAGTGTALATRAPAPASAES